MKKLSVFIILLLTLIMTACAPSKNADERNQDSETVHVQGEQESGDIVVPEEPADIPEEPIIPENPKYILTVEGIAFENGDTLKAIEIGESITLVAEDKENAVFLYWQENGDILTNEKIMSVTMERDRFIRAVYAYKPDGELEFNTEDGKTYYVAGIGSVSGDTVIIPDTYNGKPVTKIAMTAFKDNKAIKTVIIPDTITSIGKDAFSGCTSLEYINIPSSVEKIEENELSDCTSLKAVTLGINMDKPLGIGSVQTVFVSDGVEKINFAGLKNLKAVFLPESLTVIEDNVFNGCSSLVRVNIPESVEEIGDRAFYGCHSLENIVLPEGLKTIGEYAFFQCRSLDAITLPERLSYMDKGAFEACKKLTSVVLPNSLTALPEYAFTDCTSLVSVTVGKNVTEIGDSAFKGCSALANVKLPSSLKYMGESVFEGCSALADISLPHSVTEMGESVFEECSSLVKIILPERLYKLSSDSFKNCTALREITMSVNTVKADADAFDGVNKFNATVYYNGTQSEWEKSFAGPSAFEEMMMKFQANTHYDFDTGFRYTSNGDGTCHMGRISTVELTATEITIPKKSPNGDLITHIDKNTFNSNNSIEKVVIEAPLTYLPEHLFSGCTKLQSVTLPESVTRIETCAFNSCCSLTEINIPETVVFIGERAFDYCQKLASVTLPKGLESIGYGAFTNCGALKEITLGEKVNYVGQYAFSSCDSLERVNMSCTDTVFSSSIFTRNANASIYYTKGIEGWLSLDMKFGLLSDGMSLYIDGALLTEAVIPESVTEIKERAFSNITSLKKVVFHDGIKSIGAGAFYYCSGLEEIVIPESVTQVLMSTFAYCGTISRLVLPASLTYLSEDAFRGTSFDEIYYNGTREDWYAVNSLKKSYMSNSVCWYSEEQPSTKGSYWRYVDSEMVKW